MSTSSSPKEYQRLTELVELFEYKVSDLQAGREPRGGARSLRELRRTLREVQLPAPLLRRAVEAEKQYRRQQTVSTPPPPLPSPRLKEPWRAPVTRNEEEAQAWHALQGMAWHSDLMKKMHGVTQQLRAEPGRPTLRLLYAVTENAERAERGIKVLFAVPPNSDPLVSLDDALIVRQLTDTLGDMLLTPEGEQRVWQALETLKQNPFPHNPQEEWPAAQGWESGARSRAEWETQERPILRASAGRAEAWLEQHLTNRPGELAGAVPAHSILYAQEPQCALAEPGDAERLCIHLGGIERRTSWQGLRLSWRSLGPNWQLLAQDEGLLAPAESAGQTSSQTNGQTALLRPELPSSERRLQLLVGPHSLQVLFYGDYVLLRYSNTRQNLGRLGQLAALGRAVALLLDPAEAYGHMRLARALAQRLRGGPVHVGGNASRYAMLTPAERQSSARRSLEALGQLLPRATSEAVEHALRSVQQSLDLPPLFSVAVHQAAHQVAFVPETLTAAHAEGETLFLNANGVFVYLELEGLGLNVRLPGDRVMSLKLDYKDELVASLPGHVPVAVPDLQVLTLHDLTLIVVREGNKVALCALTLMSGEYGLTLS